MENDQNITGVWRCSCCGEMCDYTPAWRWTGDIWEHKCPENHPQHGYEPAKYFGEVSQYSPAVNKAMDRFWKAVMKRRRSENETV